VVRPRKSGVNPTEPPGRQGEGVIPLCATNAHLARNAREEKIVELKQARQIGMRVRVKRTYNSVPELQGQVGTINQRYGGVHHPAFKVWFEDGRSQLFWSHQLEEA
jgi:hypothetical protein